MRHFFLNIKLNFFIKKNLLTRALFYYFLISLFSISLQFFINNFTNEKTIIFLDPPYYLEKQSKLYGNNGDMHENFNHQMLFDLIIRQQREQNYE